MTYLFKAIIRYIRTKGLKMAYEQDGMLNKVVRMLIALVLLPAQLILTGLEVKLNLINCEELNKFINYCDLIKEGLTFAGDLDTTQLLDPVKLPDFRDFFFGKPREHRK